MKKIYVAPKMGIGTEIYEELICLSKFEEETDDDIMESKKRQSIDFSDEESIW